MELEARTSSADETLGLAKRIGERLEGGEVLALRGPLGAGKTTFAKGVAAGLGIDPRDVTSPTFLIIHELEGRLALRHVDAYRVGSADELIELGLGELFSPDGVVLMEWPERAPECLPGDRLDIEIEVEDLEARRLRFTAEGERHACLLAAVRNGVGQ